MTAADDTVILAALGRSLDGNLPVFDGYVTDSDEQEKTISAPLPYVVFYTTPGRDGGESLAGSVGSLLKEFQVTFVGETREQAARAGEAARAQLNRRVLSFPGGPQLVRRTDNNLTIRRDDVWTRPDGGPLFYGVDRYSAMTSTPDPEPA